MGRKYLAVLLCVGMMLAGCASQSSAISARYVTPNIYAEWECSQISTEMIRVNQQISSLTGKQDKIYKNDQMMGWIGSFFLWPLYFLIKGDGEVASDLATAKGTYEALEQIQIQKKCG